MIIIINAKLNILSYPMFKVLNALLITVTEEPLSELEIIFFLSGCLHHFCSYKGLRSTVLN